MYSRVNYTLIGSFVLLFIAGIVLFVLWLGDANLKQSSNTYIVRTTESVAGLSRDSGVKLKGVNIGSISDIRINPDNIEEVDILLSINRGVPIKEDMRAVISMFGLTGLAYIEILGGTNNAKTLEPSKANPPIIQSGISTLNNYSQKFETLYARLNKLLEQSTKLFTEKNLKNFSALVENANTATLNSKETLNEATMAIKEFRVSFGELSKNYNTLAVNFDNHIEPLVANITQTSTKLDRLTTTLQESISRGDYNMRKIMQPSMNDFRDLTQELNGLARELRGSPSNILFKSRESARGPGE